MFLDICDVTIREVKKGKGVFEARRCDSCGEATFVTNFECNRMAKSCVWDALVTMNNIS